MNAYIGIVLILTFYVAGLLIFYAKSIPLRLVFGFSILTISSSLISGLFRITLSDSWWISLAVCLGILLLRAKQSLTTIKIEWTGLLSFIAAFSLIFNFMEKLKFPLMSYNFDFLYNILDGVYLENHTINEFASADYVTPLNWSANPMGRFASSYAVAAMLKIEASPVLTAFSLYIVLILCGALLIVSISRTLLPNAKNLKTLAIGILAILAPLNLQSWSYMLLGQISGLAVIYGAIYYYLISKNIKVNNYLHPSVVLLASLYWIYPAHFVFVFVALAALLLYKSIQIKSFNAMPLMIKPFLVSALVILLSSVNNLTSNVERIASIISFTNPSGENSEATTSIFNQFSSPLGPIITFGQATYPFKGPTVLLTLGILALVILSIWIFIAILREFRTKDKTHLSLRVLLMLIITYGFTYLVIQSNYLLFKISTWSQSLLVLGAALLISSLYRKENIFDRRLLVLSLLPLSLILLASTSVIGNLSSGDNSSFKLANQKIDLTNFSKDSKKEYFLGLQAPTAEDVAWVSMNSEKRPSGRIVAIATNKQSLQSSFASACTAPFPLEKIQNIGWFTSDIDSFPHPEVSNRNFLKVAGESITVTETTNIELLIAPGYGLFYPQKSSGWPLLPGQNFRWASGSFSLNVWSKYPKTMRLEAPIAAGPDLIGKLFLDSNNGVIDLIESEGVVNKLVWDEVKLRAGWNCLEATLRSSTKEIPTNSTRADFRSLAFALGKVKLNPHYDAPFSVSRFPTDLENKDLSYSGIYKTGWLAENSHFYLKSGDENNFLKLTGFIPLIKNKDFVTDIEIGIDGKLVAKRKIKVGDFAFNLDVSGIKPGIHRVGLNFSKSQNIPGQNGLFGAAFLRQLGFFPID